MKKYLALLLSLMILFTSCVSTVGVATAEAADVYIGFTSDVHDGTENLENWLKNVGQKVTLSNMAYCGDYSYSSNKNDYLTAFKTVVDLTNTCVGNSKGIYTSGNHEWLNYGSLNDFQTYSSEFIRLGGASNTASAYYVFCMGAYSSSGAFQDADIKTLDTYLNTHTDKPVFILSHFPLHYISDRTITKAIDVINVLNKYPNAVFLWGHNHSKNSETHYGEIKTYGDSIEYKSGSSATINFNYVCAGSPTGRSGVQGNYKGVVAKVNGTKVTFTYYNTDGSVVNLHNKSSASSLTVDFSTATGTTYTAATAYTAGKSYVLASKDSGTYYVMGKNGVKTTNDFTVNGNDLTFTADETDYLWTLTEGGKLYNASAGKYLVAATVKDGTVSMESSSDNGTTFSTAATTNNTVILKSGSNDLHCGGSVYYLKTNSDTPVMLYELKGGTAGGDEPTTGVVYKKVEKADLTNGDYIVVANSDTDGMVALGQTLTDNKLNGVLVSVSNDTITLASEADAAALIWTAEFSDSNGKVTLKTADGKYLVPTYSSGTRKLTLTTTSNDKWTYNDNSQLSMQISKTTCALNYSSGDDTFNASSSPDESFAFYAKVTGEGGGEEGGDEPTTGTTYTAATVYTAGKSYVLASKDSGTYYVMGKNGVKTTNDFTVNGNDLTFTADETDYLWTLTEGGKLYNASAGKYLLAATVKDGTVSMKSSSGDGTTFSTAATTNNTVILKSGNNDLHCGSSVYYLKTNSDTPVMLYELKGGTAGGDEPTTGTTYKKVTGFTDGKEYILAVVDGTTAYCLDADKLDKYDDYEKNTTGQSKQQFASTSLTVVGSDTVTTDDVSLAFTAVQSSGNYDLMSSDGVHKLLLGNYKNTNTPAVMLIVTGKDRPMQYNSTSGKLSGDDYMLTFTSSGKTFGVSKSATAAKVVLFEKVSGGSEEPTLTVTPKTMTLTVGGEGQITATKTNTDGAIKYETLDTEIVTVDNTGKVKALKVGTANITVTVEGTELSEQVTVTVEPIPDVELEATTNTPAVDKAIAKGGTLTVKVTNGSSTAYDYEVSFSKTGVATVDSEKQNIAGKGSALYTFTGVADGDVTITIANGTESYSRKVTINLTVGEGGGDEPVTGTVYKLASSLKDGGEYIITDKKSVGTVNALANSSGSLSKASVIVKNDGDGEYITSDDASIVMTASSSGSGFKLSNNGRTLYYSSSSLSFNASKSSVWSYTSEQMKDDASHYLYYSSNQNKFSASSSHSSDKVYIFEKVVDVNVPTLTVSPETLTLTVRGEGQITATKTNTDGAINYVSSAPEIVTVDNTGKVNALKVGTANITVTVVGTELSAMVAVTVDPEADVELTASTDNPTESKTIAEGGTLTVKVTNGSSTAYDYEVSFSKTGVATVDFEKQNIAGNKYAFYTFTGVKAGEATITIKNKNSYGDEYARKVTINLTVGEGGGDEPTTGTTYKKVTGFTDGKEYILAVVDGTTAYCLDADKLDKYDDYEKNTTGQSKQQFASTSLTVVGSDTVTTDDVSLAFTAVQSSGNYDLMSSDGVHKLLLGNYKNTNTPAVMLIVTGKDRPMQYNSTSGKLSGDDYMLTFTSSGKTFGVSKSATAAKVVLFEKVSGGSEEPTLTVTPKTMTLTVGGEGQITATTTKPDGAIKYQSSDEETVTVDNTGKVNALKVGTANITVTVEGTELSEQVTVTVEPIPDVELEATTNTPAVDKAIAKGGTLTVKVTNGSSTAYDYEVSFSKTGVATVDSEKQNIAGKGSALYTFTGVDDGVVTITIANGTESYSRKVTINLTVGEGGGDEPVTGTVYKLASSLKDGGEYIITDKKSVGTVNALANSSGSISKVAVTVENGGDVAYITSDDASIVMTASSSGSGFILKNDEKNLRYSNGLGFGSTQAAWSYESEQMKDDASHYLYYSSNQNKFSASSSHSSDKVYIFEKVVDVNVPTLTVSPETLTLTVEGEGQITATKTNTDGAIIYQSSDEETVTVDDSGKVNALKVGTATITVTVEGTLLSKEVAVTVEPKADKTASVTATKNGATVNVELEVGEIAKVTVTNSSSNHGNTFTNISDDESVAKVIAGDSFTVEKSGNGNVFIQGIANGTANIVCTGKYTNADDYTATINVTVTGGEAPVHSHSFAYSANANVITATCANSDGQCSLPNHKVTLTLTKNATTNYYVYDNTAKTVGFADGEATAWQNAIGSAAPTITYAAKEGSELTENKAVKAGSYTATVTVDTNKTATLDFTIEKATPIVTTVPTASAITYGKTLADSTLTGGAGSVEGTFAWTNKTVAPAVSDSEQTEYEVTFTPNDTANYNTATCKVKVKVNKADYADVTTTKSADLNAVNGSTVEITLPAIPEGASYGTVAKTTAADPYTLGAVTANGKITATSTGITAEADMTFTVAVTPDGNHNGYSITVTITPKFHTHSFAYSANANVITATCANSDGQCGLTDHKVTLTLTAQGAVYDGNAVEAAFANGEEAAWEGLGLTLPTIVYTKADGSSVSGKPINAGSYVAGIVVNGNEAKASFSIAPRPVTLIAASDSKVYDGAPLTNPGFTVKEDKVTPNYGFIGSDGIASVQMTPQSIITKIGSVANVIEKFTLKIGTNPDNYIISTEDGTLTITGAEPQTVPTLVLPSALIEIGEEAYSGTGVECVVIPNGCKTIGSKAFADCAKLKLIEIPESVTSIAADAFDNSPAVVIVTTRGSAADTFAAAHGIPCMLINK